MTDQNLGDELVELLDAIHRQRALEWQLGQRRCGDEDEHRWISLTHYRCEHCGAAL